MAFECVKPGDKRRRGLLADWETWLTAADGLCNRFDSEWDTHVLGQHEVSVASFLACAAARVGSLAMTEYDIDKIDPEDRRKKKRGRADLWFASDQKSYSFECKRAWYRSGHKRFDQMLQKAKQDIGCIPATESSHPAGLLVGYVSENSLEERFREYAYHDEVDIAYRIGPDGAGGGYLYFSLA